MTRIWARIALVATLTLAAVLAEAQTNGRNGPDFDAWQPVATRAEQTIDADRASDRALEALRAEIVRYRQQFLDARDVNSARIETLQSQLNALGPAPENGEEAPNIASQRADLNEQLQALRAPRQAAEAAFNRANGLVSEIDRILRERQAEEVLALGPSPLNPVLWPGAILDLSEATASLAQETAAGWRNPSQRETLRTNAPLVVVLLGVAIVLLARGRVWSAMAGDYLRQLGGQGSGVWSFAVSLGRIALPVLGLYALSEALMATGMVGRRGAPLVEQLPIWGAVLLVLRWLCERLFSRQDDEALILFPLERRAEMRFYGTLLALLFVLRAALEALLEIANADQATRAVATFPHLILIGIVLLRLGQILFRNARPEPVTEGETPAIAPGFARVLRTLGRLSMLVAVIGPVLAAIGYVALAEAIAYPAVMSLALFGILVVLQRLSGDIYGWLSGQGVAARDSLIPVLIGFALTLLSLPLLALIWGVRITDLMELWTRFSEGFTLGETRISPMDFLTFIIIFLIGYFVTRLLQGALKTNLLPKTRIDTGGQVAIVSGVGYVGIFLAAIIAISGAGIDLSSLAIVAGALSVGIGFGLQNIVSNFVSGIILLIERPISEGDWIEVGGQMGYVRDISVRSTRIETFDRTDVIVPNADLVSGTVTNYTRGNTVGRVIVKVGVAYGTDTRKVEAILREIANEHPMVLAQPAPFVLFSGFGADSLDFEIRAILRDVNFSLSVRTEMNHRIAQRFIEEGIEIPFAQRDIWLRNPEALRPQEVPAMEAAPPKQVEQTETEMSEMVPDAPEDPDGPGDDTT
ncbi:DUF3772 domain-containing protein [Thalassococcus sp. S3]|uniref:DUF3772 domain-containing protein n=1 Tax=Thalassococcus sp. S3 TaxID=2017482 RepID=UPI0013EECDED|nr:DUF3772 domain-containing protein [Thalassococcus sp. S3]